MPTSAAIPFSALSYGAEVEYRVLGPLELVENGTRLDLGGPKQRAVVGDVVERRGDRYTFNAPRTSVDSLRFEDAASNEIVHHAAEIALLRDLYATKKEMS